MRSTTLAARVLCLLPKRLLTPYIEGRPHQLHSNKVSQILRFQLLYWGCAECTLYTKHKAGQIKQYKCKTKNLQNLTEVTSVPNYCIESILLYTHTQQCLDYQPQVLTQGGSRVWQCCGCGGYYTRYLDVRKNGKFETLGRG